MNGRNEKEEGTYSIISSIQKRCIRITKKVNYQNEFDRLHGAKELSALDPTAKARMKDLQNKARQSLKGDTHIIYSTKV